MDANAGAAKAARVALALHATAAARSNGFNGWLKICLRCTVVKVLVWQKRLNK